MRLVAVHQLDREKLIHFFNTHWGSPEMVVSTGVYQCDQLDGFAVLGEDEKIIGLVTYTVNDHHCEIISLDAIEENKGIGTRLLRQVEALAKERNLPQVKVITTNDNLHALLFYQKRGYQMVEVYPNAVDKAREIKPSIPLFSEQGIPIRDEILLEKHVGE
ncbi:GNAT family N-acetyltransferase [Paenibacillus enshidis]|uniref:GNAT family N-acetyltransferase n=1 Tax=Paenibacillus enshidis TaxID=1458439 RepID=A0ABV5B009_9BACL